MRPLGIFLLTVSSLGVAGYAVVGYTAVPLGENVHPDMTESFRAHRAAILAHIFGSAVALTLGPLQFSRTIRDRNISLHRFVGRAYLGVGVLIGGLAGLYVAQFSFGGFVSRSGFTVLALVWLGSGWLSYSSIRRGDVTAHRRWVIRNFAMTFAAVTLRIYLGLFAGVGLKFEDFYPWLAWLCWVPNVVIAEWLWVRAQAPPSR